MFRLQIPFILTSLLFLTPAFGQWQEIGNEQIPDILHAEKVQALDGGGLRLSDDGDNLGVFVEDGGNIGIGTGNPYHQLDIRTLTGLDTAAGSKNNVLALWGHGNRNDRVVCFTERHSTAGSTSDWTTVHHRLQRIVDSAEMGFFGFGRSPGSAYALQLGYGDSILLAVGEGGSLVFGDDSSLELSVDTAANEFRFGTSADADRLTIDTDNGNLAIEGDLDASGGGEFGDASNTRTYYQPAAAFQSSDEIDYIYSSDYICPASAGAEVYAAIECPWMAPGTRVKSAKFVVYVNTAADYVNFAVKRQSSSAPGSTTDIVAFGGSDYGQSSGLTNISGDFYHRTEICNHTIGDGEKIWAVVLLSADTVTDDCRCLGVEWMFEQRRY
jgi:hypothetical protein